MFIIILIILILILIIIKENDNKNKTQNKEYKEEEKDLKHKNSKQFMKYRSKIMQNSENELKKIGDNYNISSKIANMAMDLENKFKNSNSVNFEENKKNEIENKIASYEIIDKKPVNYKKKKTEKKVFLNN